MKVVTLYGQIKLLDVLMATGPLIQREARSLSTLDMHHHGDSGETYYGTALGDPSISVEHTDLGTRVYVSFSYQSDLNEAVCSLLAERYGSSEYR